MSSILNATTTNGLVTSADNSGSLQLQTNNGTTAVTIDTSQNVGIGTSSPTTKTEIQGGAETLRLSRSTSGSVYLGLAQAGVRKAYLESNNADVNLFAEAASSNLIFGTVGTERMRITSDGLLQFNSGYGSVATAYGCRAWVNLNGTGTIAINASGNVTSLTDNGNGDYTVNFTNAMPDANYSVSGATRLNTSNTRNNIFFSIYNSSTAFSTGSVRVNACNDAGTLFDCEVVAVAVFR